MQNKLEGAHQFLIIYVLLPALSCGKQKMCHYKNRFFLAGILIIVCL